MRGLGVRTLMHVCGDINATAAAVAATGADGIDVDHMVHTSFVASQAKRPVCIKGNLDPVALLRSTPQQVQHLCRQIIATAPQHFILGTGCLVARDLSLIHIFQPEHRWRRQRRQRQALRRRNTDGPVYLSLIHIFTIKCGEKSGSTLFSRRFACALARACKPLFYTPFSP